MNQMIKSVLVTTVIIALFSFILLLGASGIAYMNDDPDAMLFPFSIAVLGLSGVAAGVISVRTIGESPVVSGLVGAGIYLLLIAAASLLMRSGEGIAWLRVLLTVAIVILSSIIGAFFARQRSDDPMKRRKKLERRYTA